MQRGGANFHDFIFLGNRRVGAQIACEGEMPIEMMRAALTEKALTRNYNASWQFYGDVQPAKP